MKNKVFLFLFIFSPSIINNAGDFGSTKRDKFKMESEVEVSSKIFSDKIEKNFYSWQKAEASYYDPTDTSQTKENCDGVGALGRKIESGSISIGSSFSEIIKDEKIDVFIQVKDFDVITPYGKGIFRVDDFMSDRYVKKDKMYIDFFHKDLSFKYKQLGRFKIQFRFLKVEKQSALSRLFFKFR